jgi:pyruvate,water dikinase
VRELLLTGGDAPTMRDRTRRGALIRIVMANPLCGEIARDAAERVVESLRVRLADVRRDAMSFVSASESVFDILLTHLTSRRIQDALVSARASLGIDAGDETDPDLDAAVARRLDVLRRCVMTELGERLACSDREPWLHHLLRRIDQLSALLGPRNDRGEADQIAQARRALQRMTTSRIARHAGRFVIHPTDGGLELLPLIGGKAANLGELTRLLGPDCVPSWFTITDHAFRDVLAGSPGPAAETLGVDRQRRQSLEAAIESILMREHTTDAARSTMIRLLWQTAPLPAALVDAVQVAYREFADEPLVAVRSSALEEDTETTTCAGLFDTFLFVRGVASILDHLKRAWAGLWTERAIQHRRFTGAQPERTGGGVIIQRMIPSRVSGVLHTIWAVGDRPRETLINAGWGLGEGIVSGTVDADEILVPRIGKPQERVAAMRYRVGDKREQIVFDARSGVGTKREPVVLHHRRQPALDRSEILELVQDASHLEAEYGCPLDIEFAYECEQLRLLQVRPIPIHQFVLSEILTRYPIDRRNDTHERERT